ncbi:MAG TPA: NAD(P)H-hydrate dehydratase [Spirochaetota bacterium]|nr:NAD(P)H-hydrate dehydratase [Spirochaetota bacterium]
MKAVTAAEMREIDRISIEEYSIPGTVLMNNAGKAVADFVHNNIKTSEIYIFCGTGNNGGDGFTAAWYLKNYGYDPAIYIAGNREKITPTSLVFLDICEKLSLQIHYLNEKSIGELSIHKGALVIDSLTGTGFEGVLRGIPLQIVRLVNESAACVISVDIPSGLSSDGETPAGPVVKADYTITMGLPKISLVSYPGKDYCGELIITDIGFPAIVTENTALKTELIDSEFMSTIVFSPENNDIHKGDKGNTLIIGGLTGMEGAAMLTAAAMFRTGTGLVTLAANDESRKIIAGNIPELMTASLPAEPGQKSFEELLKSKKYTTLIIGPGLGRDAYSKSVFNSTVQCAADCGIAKVLIDGDGLFHLADFLKEKKLSKEITWLITPHFMEASRITGLSIEEIKRNRLKSCKKIAEDSGCITILKGPATIVSDGERSFINLSGNRTLATAGSGDVLTGIIGALVNRISDHLSAAASGVFIHGLSADVYSENNNIDSMSASDILNYIRPALTRIS